MVASFGRCCPPSGFYHPIKGCHALLRSRGAPVFCCAPQILEPYGFGQESIGDSRFVVNRQEWQEIGGNHYLFDDRLQCAVLKFNVFLFVSR